VLHDGTAMPMATVICGCGLLAALCSRFTRWAELRAGHPV